MNTTTHTRWTRTMAEPFLPGSEIFKAEITNDDSHGSDVLAFVFGDSLIEANDRANRICASVNALARFPDPAKDVADVLESLTRIIGLHDSQYLRANGDGGRVKHAMTQARELLARLTP